MNSGNRIVLMLIALVLCLFSLPVTSFADSPEIMFSVIGHSGADMEADKDNETSDKIEDKSGFALRTNKTHVSLGESFQVKASFGQAVESNAAILTCSYSLEEFEYFGFMAGEGVQVLDEEYADGEIRLTCMISSYRLSNFGSFTFTVREEPEIYGRECVLTTSVDYVLREEEGKVTRNAFADTELLIVLPGDVNRNGSIDILDLSDIIDYFGLDISDENWDSIRWFDFNGDDSIDIYDISFVAMIIMES